MGEKLKRSSFLVNCYTSKLVNLTVGGLAQLARAPALHAGGQRFESVILHQIFNMEDLILNIGENKTVLSNKLVIDLKNGSEGSHP